MPSRESESRLDFAKSAQSRAFFGAAQLLRESTKIGPFARSTADAPRSTSKDSDR
jgi:hypothetical protein